MYIAPPIVKMVTEKTPDFGWIGGRGRV